MVQTSNNPQAGRYLKWSITLLIGGILIWAPTRYVRSQASDEGNSGFITVEHGAIQLAFNAPQLKFVSVGLARHSQSFDTDPLPARVQIDQTSAQQVNVPLPGRVTKVFIELGQWVDKGQSLFAIASSEVAALKAEIEKAKAQLAFARQNLKRVRDMVASRTLPAKEEIEAQQEFNSSEISLSSALAKLQALRVAANMDNEFVVAAKRGGNVVEKRVLVGQEVSPAGDPLVVIADLRTLWVTAEQPEGEPISVKEGDPAVVTSPSLPGMRVEGKVAMVSAVVDPERRTIPIRVSVDNAAHILRPNMYAQVRFVVSAAGAIIIPSTALITEGQQEFVLVQSGERKFVKREVRAGTARGGEVYVYSGLAEHDRVVTDGALLLNAEINKAR